MKVMVIFVALLTSVLNGAGFVLLFCLWCSFWKTGAVRSLPWILAAMVFLWLAKKTSPGEVLEGIKLLQSGAFSTGEMFLYLMSVTMGMAALGQFLGWLLLLANAAFLLDRAGYSSRVVRGLKRVYDFTTPLGIVYLATTVLTSGLGWMMLLWVLRGRAG